MGGGGGQGRIHNLEPRGFDGGRSGRVHNLEYRRSDGGEGRAASIT